MRGSIIYLTEDSGARGAKKGFNPTKPTRPCHTVRMTFPQRAQGHEPALILARKWYQDGFALLQGKRPRPSPPHPIPKRSGPLLPPKRFLIAPIDILALQGMVVGDCSWHGNVAPTSCPHFRESRPHHPLPIGSSPASLRSIASAQSRTPWPQPQWHLVRLPPQSC